MLVFLLANMVGAPAVISAQAQQHLSPPPSLPPPPPPQRWRALQQVPDNFTQELSFTKAPPPSPKRTWTAAHSAIMFVIGVTIASMVLLFFFRLLLDKQRKDALDRMICPCLTSSSKGSSTKATKHPSSEMEFENPVADDRMFDAEKGGTK
jgi:hypothetical protein